MADYHPNGGREQIHLPGPSLLPLSTAVGVTVGLLGLVYSWWFVLAGGVVVLISVLRWIRAVRVEIDSLPTQRR